MENFFMNYDITTGNILGFYLISIDGNNIPTPNIEISSTKHDFYMANMGLYMLNPTTLEDQLIPVVVVAPTPTTNDRLSALESAFAGFMGV